MGKATVALDSSKWLRLRALSAHGCLPIVLVVLILLRPACAQEPETEKNVLIFESFSVPSFGTADSLKSALRSGSPWPVNFYVEYLEGQRFDNEGYEKGVFETLQHTYAGQKLDLVMAESYPALQFVLKHRDELFPGVPIVFWGVNINWIAVGQKMWPGVTGVTDNLDARATIDLALRLHPRTNTVAVITNNSEFERHWLAVVHAELVHHQDSVREIDLVGLPTGQLLERVAALPPQTVVLFQEGSQASIQPVMGAYDILAWIGQRLPTYCIFPEICLDHGGIGGVASDWEKTQIPLAAKVARRVLSGEQPDDIPVANGTGYKVRVDWRQLRRWNLLESALPPGSLVLYREATFWERYRYYIIAAGVAIVIQSALIIGLLWQRARKRKAEAVLRESEKRFRVMADSTPSLVWMCDPEGKVTYLNERRVAFTGLDPNAGYGDTWTDYVHPNDLKNVLDVLARSLKSHQSFSNEYRLRRRDGVYRWMLDIAAPRIGGNGVFAGFIGSASDVTDQKLAQEALEKMSGRLIEAQEKERRRIARELHDDICQRLTLLSLEIQHATENSGGTTPPADRMQAVWEHCSGIASDVQAISHELHSSMLDLLGLTAAVKNFCREFSHQQGIAVEFTHTGVPQALPRDVSLCLFRVVQEALHNAAKHSGIDRLEVRLQGKPDEIDLEVRDAGAGFNLEKVRENGGLGLISMQERVHLVRGTFAIDSKTNHGTAIRVRVPLVANIRTKNAASKKVAEEVSRTA
jgi:PAS domain S-box-containing protein